MTWLYCIYADVYFLLYFTSVLLYYCPCSDGVTCVVNDANNRLPPTRETKPRSSFMLSSDGLSLKGGSDVSSMSSVLALSELSVKLYQIGLEVDDFYGDNSSIICSSSSSSTNTTEGSADDGQTVNDLQTNYGAMDGKFNHPKLIFGFKAVEDQETWAKAFSVATVTGLNKNAGPLLDQDTNNTDGTQGKHKRVDGPMTKAFKKFMWQLLYMVPDEAELQHRYICSQGRIADDQNESSRFKIDSSGPTSMRITVISARGLPIKDSALKNVTGTSAYQSYVFVELQMKKSLDTIAKFRTAGQPKSQSAAFREEFEFHSIEFSSTTYIQVDIIIKNSALSLGQSETKIGTVTLRLNLLCEPPFTTTGVKEWFTLAHPKTGAPISAGDAALQLSINVF